MGLRTSARAMAMRCFCPPLSCAPRSPTGVSNVCIHTCLRVITSDLYSRIGLEDNNAGNGSRSKTQKKAKTKVG